MNVRLPGALCAVVLTLCSAAGAAPFADGARVVFYGDSLTHHGYYLTPIQTFYYTRYPDRDIRIWNGGVGGASTPEAKYTLALDVLPKRPTDIVFQLGQNDVCAGGYKTNAAPALYACATNAFRSFTANTRELRELVSGLLPDAKLAWSSVVPHDADLHFRDRPFVPCVGLEEAESRFAEFVRDFSKEAGGLFIDYYHPSLAYNRKLKDKDVYASLFPDWTHPREAGGIFMTRIFLQAQDADAVVSDVAVSAAEGKAVRTANAEVRELKRTPDGGISFVSQEKALPFPVLGKAREVADDIGFDDDLNREMLTVTGLAEGTWTLKIDGRKTLTRSAADWAKGVNLAKCWETPMLLQARKVLELVQKRAAVEKKVRDMFVARLVALRILSYECKFTFDDFADDRFTRSFVRGYLYANGPKKDMYGYYKGYFDNWKNRERMEKEIESLHLEIRKANRPAPHRYELAREHADVLPQGEFAVEAKFAETKAARAQRDFKVSLDLSRAAGVEFDFRCDDLSQFSGFPCYFRSGAGWYAGGISPAEEGKWVTVRMDKFSTIEGRPAGWDKVDLIRIVGARAGAAAANVSFRVRNFRVARASSRVLVIRGEACARRPGSEGHTHLLFANTLVTALRNVGVEPQQVSDEALTAEDLEGVSLVALPYSTWLPDGKADLISRFAQAGGKLLVCFTMPDGIGDLLGIRVDAFRHSGEKGTAPIAGLSRRSGVSGDWPEFVEWASKSAFGVTLRGKGEVLYDWASADGRSLGYPALIKTPVGYYMSYVWASGESASRDELMRTVLADLVPEEARHLAETKAKRTASVTADADWVKALPSKAGERRLAWIHSAYGLGNRAEDWDETVRKLKASGFTDVLANLCWGDTAYYKSSVLREDEAVRTRGDAYRAARAACDKYGLRLHVWLVCWNMDRCCTRERGRALAAKGRTQVSKSGKPLDTWLCPSDPENLRLEVEAMVEAAKMGADGVHLDFVRYKGANFCFCENCKRRFAERGGEWNDFRRANIDALVRGIAERLRRDFPKVEISIAARGNAGNGAVDGDAQNWPMWCRKGWLDFICPMDYTPTPTFFRNVIREQKAEVAGVKLFPGIGTSCWGGNVPRARRTAELALECRKEGLGGFAVFEFERNTVSSLMLLGEGPFRLSR